MNTAELITMLRNNARTSTEDLAKELNVAEATVAGSIAQLERDGVIVGYRAVVNPQTLPTQSVTAVVEVKITPEREGGFDRMALRIARFQEVQSCYLMSGGYDLLVFLEGDNLQQISSFISEKLSTIKGVIATATHFRMKTYKENGVALHREKTAERLPVTP